MSRHSGRCEVNKVKQLVQLKKVLFVMLYKVVLTFESG